MQILTKYSRNILQIAISAILLDFGVDRVTEGAARDQYAAIDVLNFFRCQLRSRHIVFLQLIFKVLENRLSFDEGDNGVLAVYFPNVFIPLPYPIEGVEFQFYAL